MNVANLITVLRFPLLIVIVLLLYFGGTVGQLIDAPLIVVLILMDSLDGIVARRRNEQTLIGSALDIAADRACVSSNSPVAFCVHRPQADRRKGSVHLPYKTSIARQGEEVIGACDDHCGSNTAREQRYRLR